MPASSSAAGRTFRGDAHIGQGAEPGKVDAFDGAGDRLKQIQYGGCGGVYSYPKVERVILGPGQSTTRVLWLPYRYYPSHAVLPRYSHLMLMNAEEMKRTGDRSVREDYIARVNRVVDHIEDR